MRMRKWVVNRMSAMAEPCYVCSICYHFTATSITAVLRHVGCVHAHEPNFHIVCGINGCPCTYKNYHFFRKHLHRSHPFCMSTHEMSTHQMPSGDSSEDLGDTFSESTSYYVPVEGTEVTEEAARHSAALFILKTKEVLNMTQTATNQIVNDVSEMMRNTLSQVATKVSSVLAANNISIDDVRGVSKVFRDENLQNPFHGLQTQHTQQKYFRDHLGLVVS